MSGARGGRGAVWVIVSWPGPVAMMAICVVGSEMGGSMAVGMVMALVSILGGRGCYEVVVVKMGLDLI